MPAERGTTGGYSVLGFWQPADPQTTGRQPFMAWLSHGTFTAELFVAVVTEWLVDQPLPTVLVLDNASIHKARVVQQQVAEWATCGLTRLFVPPCSPELNRIEILWRFCKHYWLTLAAYQTPDTLLQAVTQLIHDIGSPNY